MQGAVHHTHKVLLIPFIPSVFGSIVDETLPSLCKLWAKPLRHCRQFLSCTSHSCEPCLWRTKLTKNLCSGQICDSSSNRYPPQYQLAWQDRALWRLSVEEAQANSDGSSDLTSEPAGSQETPATVEAAIWRVLASSCRPTSTANVHGPAIGFPICTQTPSTECISHAGHPLYAHVIHHRQCGFSMSGQRRSEYALRRDQAITFQGHVHQHPATSI